MNCMLHSRLNAVPIWNLTHEVLSMFMAEVTVNQFQATSSVVSSDLAQSMLTQPTIPPEDFSNSNTLKYQCKNI